MNPLSETTALPIGLNDMLQLIGRQFGNSGDLVVRSFQIGGDSELQASAVYIDGLNDTAAVRDIIDSLMLRTRKDGLAEEVIAAYDLPDILQYFSIPADSIRIVSNADELFDGILSGTTAILLDGYGGALIADTRGGEHRKVAESTTETAVRGPREGFTETLRTNTALIRRKIKNKQLRLETKQIGRVTKTQVEIMYIEGIVNDKIVQEVRDRLDRIDIDGILESGYIEELIEDAAYAFFPTIANTERPDVAAAALLEGRIAILVDGTPFALIVPALFVQFFQAAEDYYHRFTYGAIRLLRLLSFFIALLGPGFYIALSTFHQEMLPTELLISLAAQREGIPFPAFVEALMMEVTFEILREAGVRMPRAIGEAVSIVGALVLGDAAVQAGLVSPAMVIVVSLTAISNFVIPAFDVAITIRLLRFLFMMLAASFGLFGITVGIIALILHLCSLRSFGVPFMSPVAPIALADQKDTLLRMPMWMMRMRPRFIGKRNRVRQQGLPPHKPPPRR